MADFPGGVAGAKMVDVLPWYVEVDARKRLARPRLFLEGF
jgi:hypothetical protein